MKLVRALHFFLLALLGPCLVFSKAPDHQELYDDLEKVWPLVRIIKIEYSLVNAQLELLGDEVSKKKYLADYEDFVKRKYFDQLKTLNLRQGKLLLILIHRELGRTPFDLIVEYRNLRRAISWNRFARMVGADLRVEYHPQNHPEIEAYIKHKNGELSR